MPSHPALLRCVNASPALASPLTTSPALGELRVVGVASEQGDNSYELRAILAVLNRVDNTLGEVRNRLEELM